MSRPEEADDFKVYQSIADRMQSTAAKRALHEIVWSVNASRVVPLVDQRMRHRALRDYKHMSGLVIAGIDNEDFRMTFEAVTPEDMPEKDFVQLCRDLNEPLQRPLELDVNRLLGGLANQGRSLVTGVTYMTDKRRNGAAFLHVPSYYLHEGAEEALRTDADGASLAGLAREQIATRISSVLFDEFSGMYLNAAN